MRYMLERRDSDRILHLWDDLTFEDHETFRGIVHDLVWSAEEGLIIDLAELEYIDSAGVGMLLLANSQAQANGVDIEFTQPSGQVAKVLFHTKFPPLQEN